MIGVTLYIFELEITRLKSSPLYTFTVDYKNKYTVFLSF